MSTFVRRLVRLLPAALPFALAATAPLAARAADAYPNRPVRVIVPFPPGSASDFLARATTQKLAERFGQQFIVDNRAGAGGLVGSQILAKATPDGYTLAVIGQPHLVNTMIHKDPGYRPLEDFASIIQLASLPNVMVVSQTLPTKTVPELVALAKAKPGGLNYGSAGIGSSSHLGGAQFQSATGIDVVHVPFKQLGDIFTEMIAGRVHFYVFPLPAAMPMIRDGKLRPIMTGTAKRAASLPDVPTMQEQGYPGYVSDSWFGYVGPAKLPPKLVADLNREIAKIIDDPDTQKRYATMGADRVHGSPRQFLELQKTEYVRFQKLVKDVGISAR
jgi:tripartite-type tricarboxylate transporter receptor subunit TctC